MHESFTNHAKYNYFQISHHSRSYTHDYFYSDSLEFNNVLSMKIINILFAYTNSLVFLKQPNKSVVPQPSSNYAFPNRTRAI